MPIIRCATELVKVAGGLITPEEADRLVKELATRSKRSVATGDITEVMLKTAKEMAEELVVEAKVAKFNKLLNQKVFKEQSTFIAASKNKYNALKAIMVGTTEAKRSAGDSVAVRQRMHALRFKVRMLEEMKEGGVLPVFLDKANGRSIAKELAQLSLPDGKPGVSGNVYAQQAAAIIYKWQGDSRSRLNALGAWIRPLPGYVARTAHDANKIRRAGYQAWAARIGPLLNERTFRNIAEGDEDKFMYSVWEALSTRVHFTHADQDVDLTLAFKGTSSVAKRLSRERLLHFNDADGWFDYHEAFGHGDFHEAILSGFDFAARDIGLMEKLGTNPHNMIERLKEVALKERRTDAALGNAEADKDIARITRGRQLDNFMKELDGTTYSPVNITFAKVAAAWRNWTSMSKLGNSTISSFNDLASFAAEMNYQGKNYLASYGDALGGLFEGRGKAEREHLGSLLLSASEGMLGGIHRWSLDEGAPGMSAKALQLFFEANMQTRWNDLIKGTTVNIMSTDMAITSRSSWAALSPESQRMYSRYGVGETEWQFAQDMVGKSPSGASFVFPERALEIPNDVVRAKLGDPRMNDASVTRFKRELQTKIDAMFVDRADYAVPTPGASERAALLQGTQPGTVLGETLRFWAQFKSFPATYLSKVIGRETIGRVPGGVEHITDANFGTAGFVEGLKHGQGSLAGLVQMMIGTTAIGYVVLSTKELIQGKKPRDPKSPKTWSAAMAQGGGLGIYGDYLFGEFNRFGKRASTTLAGPTFGQMDDFFDIRQTIMEGKDPRARILQAVKGNTPFIGLPYIKPALDYLFLYQLQENMNPGYLRRMERRIKKENNQEYIWPPSRYSQDLFNR